MISSIFSAANSMSRSAFTSSRRASANSASATSSSFSRFMRSSF